MQPETGRALLKFMDVDKLSTVRMWPVLRHAAKCGKTGLASLLLQQGACLGAKDSCILDCHLISAFAQSHWCVLHDRSVSDANILFVKFLGCV